MLLISENFVSQGLKYRHMFCREKIVFDTAFLRLGSRDSQMEILQFLQIFAQPETSYSWYHKSQTDWGQCSVRLL